MEGICSCHAPYEGDTCEKISFLATNISNNITSRSKPAVLLSMQRSNTSAQSSSNASSQQNSTKVNASKTEGATIIPLTASWLTSGVAGKTISTDEDASTLYLNPLAPSQASKAPEVLNTPIDAKVVWKTAKGDSDAWHQALIPPANTATAEKDAKKGSMLSLLSTEAAGASAWTERPLDLDAQIESVQPAREPAAQAAVPKKLTSLLALAPKATPANQEEAQASDIDLLLKDI